MRTALRSINGRGGNHKQPLLVGRRNVRIVLFLVGAAVPCLVVYNSAYRLQSLLLLPSFYAFEPPLTGASFKTVVTDDVLWRILQKASIGNNKTVIITTLNKAWAETNSTFDLFLESFKMGEGTEWLLRHLVVICLDEKAYARCSEIHRHCYFLTTTGVDFSGEKEFMTPDYLKMMWRRIQLLGAVLQMGYNFIFTDVDIMWLRDPFPRLYPYADFQIACDRYIGNPYDTRNSVNGGFAYVKSNNRSIRFYEFWYSSRQIFPGRHDQDVFNEIKWHPVISKIGLQIRFLDTVYFGGFCQASKDLDLVCTMHANCCIGLENKVRDLRQVLEDWRKYVASQKEARRNMVWSIPENCQRRMGH